jgi:transposase
MSNETNISIERAAVQTAVTMMVKLGIDQHAADVVVSRQDGERLAKPARRMTMEQLLEMAAGLLADGVKVYSCYEAGPCGYGLHRRLVELGVANLVVVPRRWDPEGRRVKTDKRDARQLCDALDRYLRGNTEAFSIVRVPTEEQERRRAISRQRGMLLKERQRAVLRGHGLMLTAGFQAPPGWWRPQPWAELAAQLPAGLRVRVQCWQKQAVELDAAVDEWTAQVESFAPAPQPKGIGAFTAGCLELEIFDWHRFNGRRGISSYTGLCPSEESSGTSRRQGSVTKHGNPRVRHWLVEAVWRLLEWQPDYPPLRKLRAATSKRQRKRLAVAAARRLAIDLWRLNTGRCTAEQLGLRLQ